MRAESQEKAFSDVNQIKEVKNKLSAVEHFVEDAE